MSAEKRFWEKVKKSGGDDCWEWTAYRTPFGYGRFSSVCNRGKPRITVNAHRFSWEIHNGKIPDNVCVLHHCDNPPCCNPRHLFLGTRQDNMADMVRKGRAAKQIGESNPRSFLTEDVVLNIRKLSKTHTPPQIGRKFNISRQLASKIVTYKIWRHVL